MCYSGQSVTKQKLDYAKKRGDEKEVARLEQLLLEMELFNTPRHYSDGFSHPQLLVFTNLNPLVPQAFTWGLIPAWCKSIDDAKKAWNTTLNARGETIFEKPSFKNSAKNKRCLIYLDAFYEFHHVGKGTIPFRISLKDETPMPIAGLWEEWVDKSTGEILKTVTIVTTEGNSMMSQIHNNKKAEMGPRMPVIFTKEQQNEWLMDCKSENDIKHLQSLIKPIDAALMTAYTVGKLKGKEAIGNVPEVTNEVKYPDFELHW